MKLLNEVVEDLCIKLNGFISINVTSMLLLNYSYILHRISSDSWLLSTLKYLKNGVEMLDLYIHYALSV